MELWLDSDDVMTINEEQPLVHFPQLTTEDVTNTNCLVTENRCSRNNLNKSKNTGYIRKWKFSEATHHLVSSIIIK